MIRLCFCPLHFRALFGFDNWLLTQILVVDLFIHKKLTYIDPSSETNVGNLIFLLQLRKSNHATLYNFPRIICERVRSAFQVFITKM